MSSRRLLDPGLQVGTEPHPGDLGQPLLLVASVITAAFAASVIVAPLYPL